jgi:hypothetical protein
MITHINLIEIDGIVYKWWTNIDNTTERYNDHMEMYVDDIIIPIPSIPKWAQDNKNDIEHFQTSIASAYIPVGRTCEEYQEIWERKHPGARWYRRIG